MSQTDYLNAMGISTWVLQDAEEPTETPVANTSAAPAPLNAAPKVIPNVTPKQRQSSP